MGCDLDDENTQPNPNTETVEISVPESIQIFEKGSTPTEYGFHLYIPPEYDQNTAVKYPLLIYLHGGGGRGNGTANSLPGLVQDGVPRLIVDNRWNPTNPMIVIIPQSPGLWNADHLHDLIAYAMDTYPVVRNRVYMTGLYTFKK